MNRLVSVGGLCFVAGTPENAANLSDKSDRPDGSDIAGPDGAGSDDVGFPLREVHLQERAQATQ